ncbi:EAL domain-containing protein [Niveibacterium sp. 24ML]|uniref:GGDEF/EAL domain-containing response regulator n=1 Tax=Niveibacterium sp. 24ML TaxID=2985512 RepID=UPI00226DF379|nr:EAL domain-containing protein [Niveibacterium sp. 24ML]MCX9156974.1 EAL domain-containing protein [Niveibacterium sp. 24ML]
MTNLAADDELVFAPEGESGAQADTEAVWRVLIVDDDHDVHASTELALKGTPLLGRRVQFLHTYSAAETVEFLRREHDIAVILLDVVMESENAGLKLVHVIREELGLSEARIVLRTGQPGYAPEIQAIRDYDINDYKTKSELTHTRLYTTLTVAIRSYDQIRAINASRRGLDMIVRASGELMELRGMQGFAAGVITQLAALLRLPPEGLICAQENGRGEEAMQVVAAGGKFSGLINQSVRDIPNPDVREHLNRALSTGRNQYDSGSTTLLLTGSGRRIAVYLESKQALSEIDRNLLEVFCANIAVGFENTALFGKLTNLAYVDALTHLPNRLRFLQELDEHLRGPRRVASSVALVDIDEFAETNDALGHQFGDRLLRAVAHRLRDRLPDTFIARVAGDTFGILGASEKIKPAALVALFEEAFMVDDQEIVITATLGLLDLSEVDVSGGEALKNANIALKRAKRLNRGQFVYFTGKMDFEIRERHDMLRGLRNAFDSDRLFVMYQPQVLIETGEPVGVEALIRWRKEDGSFVPPDRFIPLAETSGLIIGIGNFVMRLACFEQVKIAAAGFPKVQMAINVSLAQFRHPRFIDQVREALADTGATPSLIELEITESMAMEDADFVARTLNQLGELGVKVAVDDFGTGFSSLSYLQRLRVDRLKIDKAFVQGLCSDPRGRQIPEMVIQLGKRLGLAVIAEGVEDIEQANTLVSLGCYEAQGYLYARPMEPAALYKWLAAKRPAG